MNQLYLKKSTQLEEMSSVKLLETETVNENEKEKFIVYNEKRYIIQEKLSDKSVILGYAIVSKKENKQFKVKTDEIKTTINNEIAILKETGNKKVIGYIRVEKEDTYIGLIEEKKPKMFIFLPFIIFSLITFVVAGSLINNKNNDKLENQTTVQSEEDTSDDKGNGQLGVSKAEFGEQQMFRLKINCTPTLENGKMNIRIESPAEENKNLAFKVKVYVLEKVDSEGKVVETYENNLIYTSPMVYANENIENCTVKTEIETGKYVGRAVYEIYDLEGNAIGQTACRLNITVK